eukprot:4802374-Pyramimonas_sp.AAC.1
MHTTFYLVHLASHGVFDLPCRLVTVYRLRTSASRFDDIFLSSPEGLCASSTFSAHAIPSQSAMASCCAIWQVTPYGSFLVEALATFESDVDMRVDGWQSVDDNACVWDIRERQSEALHVLHDKLLRDGWATCMELRDRAIVPIIVCVDVESGISLDISLGEHLFACQLSDHLPDTAERRQRLLGNDTTQIAAAFVRRWPQLFPPIVTLMKVVFAQLGLDKPFTGGMGSFKLYCLVAYFLQNVQQLPSQVQSRSLAVAVTESHRLINRLAAWSSRNARRLPSQVYPNA